MDLRAAVAVHLCLLAARASCRPVGPPDHKEALNLTAQLVTENLQPLLTNLSVNNQTNSKCQHLNGTELGEPEERPLTAAHLSSFCCYTLKLSQMSQTSNIHPQLKDISHQLDSMAALMPSSTAGRMLDSARVTCSLPVLHSIALFDYIECLLRRLDHRLRNATF